MEQERTPPATKRARPSPPPQAHAADAEDDRLSALDDAALHGILARVPLRDAAATAALSRRWPRVFATLPRLRLHPATFNRRDFPDEGNFDHCEDPWRWMAALRRVLDGRAAPVAAFVIDFKYMGRFDVWFLGVFRELCGSGGLLELNISNSKLTECYDLPSPVYTCRTLTTLDLFNWRLRVPGRITGLRALRFLRLRGVTATDDELRRFISRCSSMEHLEIVNIHKARNIVIRAPCLEKLVIYSHRPLCVSVKKAPRLDTVRLSFSYSYPEFCWSREDTMDSDEDYSDSEIDKMHDYEKMAEREHEQTDEIGNLVTFLGGLGSAKKLHLSPDESPKVLSMVKTMMPKRLPKKNYLLGLEMLTLALDHNHAVFGTLVSCLLNSSPNLKDLRISDSCRCRSPVPLPAEYWEEQINAECVLNHLSSVTFFIDELFEGHPCGGFCRFLVMNSRVLKKLRIVYYRWQVKSEHADKLEEIRRELHLWPRASPDLVLELSPLDRYPSL